MMNADTVYEVISKLIGDIHAVGETNADNKRLNNLKEQISLIEKLIFDVHLAATTKDRVEASMKKIGTVAFNFLNSLKGKD